MTKIIDRAKEVFDLEIAGIETLRDSLDGEFEAVVENCLKTIDSGGKIIITGIGKSGYIGQKIAATLSSIGSPALFMHPVEALHGDLGIMQDNDIMMALSYSGETEELLRIMTPAKRLGIKIIAVTGNPESSLAKHSDIILGMAVSTEACPFNLAPTTTTTALLALGDALAMVLLDVRGFTKEDYGRLHPGGAIGRSVTMTVEDIMRHPDRMALVTADMTVKGTLLKMTQARCGSAIVIDENEALLGIFTDGDFRRHAENDLSILDRQVTEVMTTGPIAIDAGSLAIEVMKIIENKRINDIVVVNKERKVVGLIDVQDLPGFKLM
jgi:arabinose-5-phosphate isomerase